MKTINRLYLLLFVLMGFPLAAQSATAISSTPDALWNLTEDGFVFNGYDVVSVFPDPAYPENRQAMPKHAGEKGGYVPEPLEGNKTITSEYLGMKLAFANAQNKARFDQTPDELKSYFLPKFGGWCAKAMSSGYLVEINPSSSVVLPDSDGNLVFITQAADLARTAFIQNLERDYLNAEHNWGILVESVKQDSANVEQAKNVGIQGNVKAAGNVLASFFSSTPDVESLQLPKLR